MSEIVAREFRSPRSKLARARHHTASLNDALLEYATRVRTEQYIEPVGEHDGSLYERAKRILAHRQSELPDGTEKIVTPYKLVYAHRLYVQGPPLEDVNAIASDAVQNLRQALDHAACACARSIGRTDKDTYFPLIKAGDDLEERIEKQARKLPPSVRDMIRLYEPGGGLLSELHALGIADKHRQICEFRYVAAANMQRMQAGPGWVAAGLGDDEWDPTTNCLTYALSGSPAETNYKFEFTLQIRFNTGGVLATKPAVTTLDDMANLISDIIGKMEAEMIRLLSLPQR